MGELTELGAHVEITTGYPFRSSRYTADPGGVRLLRGDNIVQGRIRWDTARFWPVREVPDYARYQLRVGDLVLAMDRPWIAAGLKYAELRRGDVPSLLVQRTARLRARIFFVVNTMMSRKSCSVRSQCSAAVRPPI